MYMPLRIEREEKVRYRVLHDAIVKLITNPRLSQKTLITCIHALTEVNTDKITIELQRFSTSPSVGDDREFEAEQLANRLCELAI